jgi:hypothetical protein
MCSDRSGAAEAKGEPRVTNERPEMPAASSTLYFGLACTAHSVGQTAQLTDLFGFALLVNARTRARHRAREPLSVAT